MLVKRVGSVAQNRVNKIEYKKTEYQKVNDTLQNIEKHPVPSWNSDSNGNLGE